MMNKPLSPRVILSIIIILGALLRFVYLGQAQNNPLVFFTSQVKVFDEYNFVTGAKDILSHPWLGSKPTDWTATYSYLIAILFRFFGEDLNVIFVFQILMGILAIFIFYQAAKLLFEDERTGLIAATIAAFYSPFLYYECDALRASLVIFLNITSFYFLLKAVRTETRSYFFLGGLMLGLSMIFRENILPFFIVPYIFFATKENYSKRSFWVALFIVGILIPIVSLSLRNKAVGQEALISRTGPTIFWIGNSFDSAGIDYRPSPVQQDLAKETEGRVFKTLGILWREIQNYPQKYKSLYGRKFKMLLNAYEIPSNTSYDLFKAQSPALRWAVFNFGIICPLAILGLFLAARKVRHVGLLYIFFFVTSFFVFAFHVQSRYRIPAVPFYIIFAAYALFQLYVMAKTRNYRILGLALLVLGVLILFTKPDDQLIQKYFRGRIRYTDYNNLANAYVEKYYRQQSLVSPDKKVLLLNEAIKNLQKAEPLCQNYWRAEHYFMLGRVYLELQNDQESLTALRQALFFEPDNPRVRQLIQVMNERQKASDAGRLIPDVNIQWNF